MRIRTWLIVGAIAVPLALAVVWASAIVTGAGPWYLYYSLGGAQVRYEVTGAQVRDKPTWDIEGDAPPPLTATEAVASARLGVPAFPLETDPAACVADRVELCRFRSTDHWLYVVTLDCPKTPELRIPVFLDGKVVPPEIE